VLKKALQNADNLFIGELLAGLNVILHKKSKLASAPPNEATIDVRPANEGPVDRLLRLNATARLIDEIGRACLVHPSSFRLHPYEALPPQLSIHGIFVNLSRCHQGRASTRQPKKNA